MTAIYLQFLFAHYGLYGNAPVTDQTSRPDIDLWVMFGKADESREHNPGRAACRNHWHFVQQPSVEDVKISLRVRRP